MRPSLALAASCLLLLAIPSSSLHLPASHAPVPSPRVPRRDCGRLNVRGAAATVGRLRGGEDASGAGGVQVKVVPPPLHEELFGIVTEGFKLALKFTAWSLFLCVMTQRGKMLEWGFEEYLWVQDYLMLGFTVYLFYWFYIGGALHRMVHGLEWSVTAITTYDPEFY